MNYGIYRLKPTEAARFFLEYCLIAGISAYLFYDSIWAFFILIPFSGIFLKKKRKELIAGRKKELVKEFKDMILSVSTALSAGYSIENSFIEAHKDMINLYGEDSIICEELKELLRQTELGNSIEKVLSDFSFRTDIEEIKDFSEIFSIAKRNGGDFSKMITHTVNIMREKDETEREIEVLLSGKRFEQKIMGIIPLIIIFYLRFSTGSFMNVLYHNPVGIASMSVCLVIYGFSYFLSERIAAIEV
ncbi:MAG: type II secretion system F family protein [Lachnospiraceae bacterium]|nr:type II secretion system F family protein [Lachnospiraceae bacterium]